MPSDSSSSTATGGDERDRLRRGIDRTRLGRGGTQLVDGLFQGAAHDLVCTEQTIATLLEMRDLRTTGVTPSSEVREHTLPQRLCVGDELTAMRLGSFDFRQRGRLGSLAMADRVRQGFGADRGGLLVRRRHHAVGFGVGTRPDRRRGLTRGRQHACGLLPEELGQPVLVELDVGRRALLGVGQLDRQPRGVLVHRAHVLGEREEVGAHLVDVVAAERARERVASEGVSVDGRRCGLLATPIRHCGQRTARCSQKGAKRGSQGHSAPVR